MAVQTTTAFNVNQKISNSKTNYTTALTILTSLFFIWGFITCLNDILIPHLKLVFSLNYAEAMLIPFCFFTAYFIVSLPSGMILEKIGYKRGIIIGLTTAGVGCLVFYPAAGLRSYPLFLIALFILASGITLLQVADNPYVAILGKPETASSRLNLTQAFNSLVTTIAPLFGSLIILSVAVKNTEGLQKLSPSQLTAYKLAEASSVQAPYLALAAALLIIAGIFAMVKLPEIEAGSVAASNGNGKSYDDIRKNAWGYKHLYLGAIGIFVYAGAEISIGSFLVNYFGSKEILSMPAARAGNFVAFYWGGAMVERFVGSGLQRVIKPTMVLAFNAFVLHFLL